MKKVFGAIAFVVGVADITRGVIKISNHQDYGVFLLLVGIAFIGLGVWLEVKSYRKGRGFI